MLIASAWDNAAAEALNGDELELLRYRSNALGADLRITNFGGGNTSSKFGTLDPATGRPIRVMAVKGSGGDLGSIRRSGFALLHMDKLEALESVYRGEQHEDEMVAFYPGCALDGNNVPASIDTPLHAFIPHDHVDHLHPDWAIALAASANGKARLEEFNERYGHKLAWIPWRRPGFELGLMLRQAARQPGCDGFVLASHGLFTWGRTQRECYESSLRLINELGEFVLQHEARSGTNLFGGQKHQQRADAAELAIEIFPFIRDQIATRRRSIGHFTANGVAGRFINSRWAPELSALGTSCPDHFVRTRIAPLLIEWDPAEESFSDLKTAVTSGLEGYRLRYTAYYESNRDPDSPPLRDPNPTVVLVPGVGMFSFGRSKKEARITGEFYTNAINVMSGSTSMEDERSALEAGAFRSFHNYVALPPREAFRIEYWALEEAKLRRMPAEKEHAGKVFLAMGDRDAAFRLAGQGAHLMLSAHLHIADKCRQVAGEEAVATFPSGDSPAKAIRRATEVFGGVDEVVEP